MNINSRSDIIIPFNQIGEDGWQDKAHCIIQAVYDNWGDSLPDPISEHQLLQLEKTLGAIIPKALRMFYAEFGTPTVNHEFLPFDEVKWLKDIYSIDKEPYYGPYFTEEDLVVYPYLIAFSDYLGSGNLFCFHSETDAVYFFDHDTKPHLSKLFDSVDAYLKACLIEVQSDLFGEDVTQEQVDKWIEEVLISLFGEEANRKWRY